MADCCEAKGSALDVLRERQRGVLLAVLWINVVLFAVESLAGYLVGSSALVADSLDNLGDVLVYAASLYVVGRALRWRARAALLKGVVQLLFGVAAVIYVVDRIVAGEAPLSLAMAVTAGVALAGNLACFFLLMGHRQDDINMRSVWLCSRNDVIGNVAVIAAAGLVYATGSHWPDVVAGSIIAAVFLRTGIGVVRDSRYTLRHGAEPSPASAKKADPLASRCANFDG